MISVSSVSFRSDLFSLVKYSLNSGSSGSGLGSAATSGSGSNIDYSLL